MSDQEPSERVQTLTYRLASQQLGDWWISLVKETDETLNELATFLRVPCGDEAHDKRADQGVIAIERELLGRLVRREWVKGQADPKQHFHSWSELSESEREIERCIGYACKQFVKAGVWTAAQMDAALAECSVRKDGSRWWFKHEGNEFELCADSFSDGLERVVAIQSCLPRPRSAE